MAAFARGDPRHPHHRRTAGDRGALITGIPNSPQVITVIDSVDMLGGPEGFGVGTRWRETRTMFGKEATEETEVSAVTRGTSYSVFAASHGVRYESTFTLQPTGVDQCTLRMVLGGEPTSTMRRAMAATIGRLFVGQTRRAPEEDLADIAAAAEAQARTVSFAEPCRA